MHTYTVCTLTVPQFLDLCFSEMSLLLQSLLLARLYLGHFSAVSDSLICLCVVPSIHNCCSLHLQEPASCLFELNAFGRQDQAGFNDVAEGGRAVSPAAHREEGAAGARGVGQAKSSATAPRDKLPVVTSLSWSCTGQTVAASYGRLVLPLLYKDNDLASIGKVSLVLPRNRELLCGREF